MKSILMVLGLTVSMNVLSSEDYCVFTDSYTPNPDETLQFAELRLECTEFGLSKNEAVAAPIEEIRIDILKKKAQLLQDLFGRGYTKVDDGIFFKKK